MNSNLKKSIIFMIVVILVVVGIGVLAYFILLPDNEVEEIKRIDEIPKLNLHIMENDTDIYKEEFKKLKVNLDKDEVDYKEYAESVAKMFIIDLYTINNKTNKYDVGGLDFVLPSKRDNYILNVTNTIYNYVEDNSNGKRKQSLPEVSNVEITKVEEKKFTINATKEVYDAYVFTMNINYVKDLGYDKEAEVIVINKDNFMYVVEKN